MAKQRTIDTHTHICTLETAALISKAGVKVAITPMDGENAAFDVAGTVYRPFPTGGFDIPRRLKDMDATSVDVHVLSASPQTYLYNVEPELAATVAAGSPLLEQALHAKPEISHRLWNGPIRASWPGRWFCRSFQIKCLGPVERRESGEHSVVCP